MRRATLLVLLTLVPVADARGDGLPLVDLGARPASIGDGDARFAALRAGRAGTVVARLRGGGIRSRFLRRTLAVPAVAYDGTPGGLSADGRTLALIEPRTRFPRRRTHLTVLDRRLDVRHRLTLDGDFSFDAISPDGSALFLVEYPDRRDPSVYRVRVYDLAAGRLLPEPLLDSRVAAIVMRGLPVTRATDGSVAYTLYDGFGEPFIHALDTARRSALCIPLPPPGRRDDPMAMRMRVSGRELAVSAQPGAAPFAVVNLDANTVRRPFWLTSLL